MDMSRGNLPNPRVSEAYYSPQFLPSSAGERLLVVGRGDRAAQVLQIANLTTGNIRTLRKGAYPVYTSTGQILYRTDGSSPGLWAWAFSASRVEPEGEPVPLLNMAWEFGASADGSLIWTDFVGSYDSLLVWRDRSGKKVGEFGPPARLIRGVSISRDGTRAAYEASDRGNADIWIQDLVHGSRSRFTFAAEGESNPVWSPTSAELAFRLSRVGAPEIHVQPVDRAGAPVTVVSRPGLRPSSWSPDGSILLFSVQDPNTGFDLWSVQRNSNGAFADPKRYLQTPFMEIDARFSPTGRMIAYSSNANGRFEVYTQSFPSGAQKHQVSVSGGTCPVWSPDASEIFFVGGDRLYSAVANQAGSDLRPPLELFRIAGRPPTGGLGCPYDIHPDGKRFLFAEPVNPDAVKPPTINFMQNWPALLRQTRTAPAQEPQP